MTSTSSCSKTMQSISRSYSLSDGDAPPSSIKIDHQQSYDDVLAELSDMERKIEELTKQKVEHNAAMKVANETIKKQQSDIEHAKSFTDVLKREQQIICDRAMKAEGELGAIKVNLASMGLLDSALNLRKDDNRICRCFKE